MTDHRFSDAEPGDSQIASLPWLGANFWSRTGGPRMWSRYDGDVVREELAVLAEHGLTVTRSFCYWPDFVPEPERLDEEVLERFADFLDAHVELGMHTIPTFIVGHMSGENWDPSWRQGRDLYRDVWLVSQQAWFAGEIARRFGPHPAVVAWLVSNEMPLYGGPGTSDEITAWARLVVQAVRAAGATQPISLGDGAWGVEISGNDNGYSLRALAPLVDFFGPHSYPMQDDQARLSLTPAFACELAGSFGKPVILEEFGVSSDFASEENAAAHYRQVLYTTLLAGARGWLAWNNCDYDDLRDQDPVPPPHLRAPLRAHRPQRPAEGAAPGDGVVRGVRARARGRRLGARQGRRRDRGAGALRAGASLHEPRRTGRTSATSCCRRTSPPARPTSRSSSCASATASRTARSCTSLRARSCSPLPASIASARWRRAARPSTSPTSRAARRISAARG